jgi:hypothetical protein
MTSHVAPAEDYREQLHRWSCLLSSNRMEEFQAELAANAGGEGASIHLYISSSERRGMLREELGMVALTFPDLDVQIDAYIQATPRTAFDLEFSETENFLCWLKETHSLTPQQAAFVGYQLGEYAVLALARHDRIGHVRFQERLRAGSGGPEYLERMGGRVRLYLNPIRIWQRLVALEPASDLPSETQDMLFYAAVGKIRVLKLDPGKQRLLRDLAERAPCTLDEWAAHSGSGGGVERELAAQLARQGVIALAE